MKILAIERNFPDVCSEALQPFLKSEASKVWELYQAGLIREAYFRQDRSEAVLMLECGDVEEALEILQSLPLVQEGLIVFDFLALSFPG